MLAQQVQRTEIRVPEALLWTGIVGGSLGVAYVLAATLAYLPGHPEFSILTTYLSDIGDTPGWPQIIFNAGTLIVAPIRLLVLALLILRLSQFGAGRVFAASALTIGILSTSGTVLMTAVPFSVGPTVHKAGIGLYFLGVVFLQAVIFGREWSLRPIPRWLPFLCLLMIAVYLVFFTLFLLYQAGVVDRSVPVIWEWLCAATSLAWVFGQSLALGREK
jgi:hypothetical membrane protein